MVKFNYALNTESYDVKNALLWGNFDGHVKKAKTGSLGNRVVHVMIAAAEFLPVVGQIASLIECFVVKVFGEKPQSGGNRVMPEPESSGNRVIPDTGHVARELTPLEVECRKILAKQHSLRGLTLRIQPKSKEVGKGLMLRINGTNDNTVTACYYLKLGSAKAKGFTYADLAEMKEAIKSKLIQNLSSSEYKDPEEGRVSIIDTEDPNTEDFEERQKMFAEELAKELSKDEFDNDRREIGEIVNFPDQGFAFEVSGLIERQQPLHVKLNINVKVAFFNPPR